MKRRLVAAAAVLAIVAGGVAACDSQCTDGSTVCDGGVPLIYAPYLVPAYGIYGQPGYRPGVTIYPGAPNYHVTYVNKPPNYTPPTAPAPPAANPANAKPTAPVKAPAPNVKTPSTPGVNAPRVNAPAVKAPSVKVGK